MNFITLFLFLICFQEYNIYYIENGIIFNFSRKKSPVTTNRKTINIVSSKFEFNRTFNLYTIDFRFDNKSYTNGFVIKIVIIGLVCSED